MSNRLYMPFYFSSWRSNAKLRRCSPAARGYWIDIMSVLHDSEEYGLVRWPLKELARAAGTPMRYARELVEKGVLKGSDTEPVDYLFTPTHGRACGQPVQLIEKRSGACWFSSKMLRDEYVRKIRGSSSRFPRADAVSPSPMGGFGDGFGAASKAVSGDGLMMSEALSSKAPSSFSDCKSEASTQLSRARVREPNGKADEQQRLAIDACRVMEAAGIPRGLLNVEHPFLTAALEAGATPGMFEHPAKRGMKPGVTDPFAYACKAVSGQLEDAKRGKRPEPEQRDDRRGGVLDLGGLLKRAIGGGAA